MKNLFLSLGLCAVLVSGAFARQTVITPKGAHSDTILFKIHQVNLLVDLLPLALKKEQFSPVLDAIEKARQKEKQIKSMEDDDLTRIEADLTSAVDNALDKGAYPPTAMQVRAAKLLNALSIRRQVALSEMTDEVLAAVKSALDQGQQKVMENTLDPYLIDPSIKKDSLDSNGKVRFYIRFVLLDPVAYDLLVKLQKAAS